MRAVLTEGGAPEALARPATGALGEQAAELLRADPWQLLAVPGVRPEQADGFARALLGAGCGPDDERRTAALVGWVLERAALQGHTALDAEAVRAALAERAVRDPDGAVRHAVEEGVALVFQEGAEAGFEGEEDVEAEAPAEGGAPEGGETEAPEPVQVLLGLDRYALAEESLADGLARLLNACEKDADWAEAAAAAPSPSAAELIRTAATAGLVVHSGGEAARAEPAALIAAARGLGLRALGAAHSEDGRRRLAGAIGAPEAAVTLAGLLSGTEGPGRDEDGALALDLLVVLDAPQLDVEGAAVLVEALADGARLVLSGDPGVLGSAGAGRVFADVLAARACPQVVSRTPDPGPIGELVSGIGIGELNQVAAPGKEVVIVPVRDAGEAVHRTVQLVADSVPRAFSIPAADTQVITVGHGGAAGTRVLNEALKQRLNPGPGRFGGFDPGDRWSMSRTRPCGARGGALGRRGGAASGLRRHPRRRTAGAGGGGGAARLGAQCPPGGRNALARRGGGAAGRRGGGAEPPVGLHRVRPGRAASVRGARGGPGAPARGGAGPGPGADDPAAPSPGGAPDARRGFLISTRERAPAHHCAGARCPVMRGRPPARPAPRPAHPRRRRR